MSEAVNIAKTSKFLDALGKLTAEAQDEKKRVRLLCMQRLQKAVEAWSKGDAHAHINAAAKKGESQVNVPFAWKTAEFGSNDTNVGYAADFRLAVKHTSPDLHILLHSSAARKVNSQIPETNPTLLVTFMWHDQVQLHRKRKAAVESEKQPPKKKPALDAAVVKNEQ